MVLSQVLRTIITFKMLMVEKIMNWREFSKSKMIRKLTKKNCFTIDSQVFRLKVRITVHTYLLK